MNQFKVTLHDNSVGFFDINRIKKTLSWAIAGYSQSVSEQLIINEAIKNMYDGINIHEINQALVLAATAFIERDPAYGYIAARLVIKQLFYEVTQSSIEQKNKDEIYRDSFIKNIKKCVSIKILDKKMLDFDLKKLSQALVLERDDKFFFMGIKTLYERYFIKQYKQYYELPQSFWMRVAMGLSLNETNKNERAIEFYNLMSQLNYLPSTPTLLHSGFTRPQLSSCFLTTVKDDLHHIFKCIGDNAQMAKWSGGIANDWTNIRATGAMIKSINTESQGVIPFLKVANDTTASINRSGKRRGASVVYLETWHYDIEDFLDLKRNTGDERRRTHDINTANWIPDLFMKRVISGKKWTLFSPHEVPDLHDLYGKKFEERYSHYEQMVAEKKISMFKEVDAKKLWRKMLTRLFETGHPWVTFKDSFNVRNTQDHAGIIHSTNLCTEISLNTSQEETAVCNIGSINLSEHVINGEISTDKLESTIATAMRMLDNVIDINYYPVKEGKTSNMLHRPVGLGIMGFQDVLFKVGIPFSDKEVLSFSDKLMEKVSYFAIYGSSKLAKERGTYSSYKGSKWDRNTFPQDTIALLEKERNMPIDNLKTESLDWSLVREHVAQYGMRNSNTMAIAPTATIANIANCFPCIEPIYKNIYVKSNMSGEFIIINHYLINDLKSLGLWDQQMINELKFHDGSLTLINRIPKILKEKYQEAFDLDPRWMVKISSQRCRWIDQSQSHNVFIRGSSGKLLNDVYIDGWKQGIKSFYYLRSLGATQVEKSTLPSEFKSTLKRSGTINPAKTTISKPSMFVPKPNETSGAAYLSQKENDKMVMCSILNGPDCDSCQ